jgi:sensor histidine kinase YesM
MLITFIENAFKHGISYQHDSLIEVKAEVLGDELHFVCRNSKAEKSNEEKGGVGLANVKQRLKLLYDNAYTLDIQDETDIYSVQLIIPLS